MLYSLLAQAAPVVPVNWYEEKWFLYVIAIAILVVPYLFGERLARSLRMPDYGWKIGLIFVAIVSGLVIDIMRWPPRLGIDLQGGVRLVYQLDPSKLREVNVSKLIEQISTEANKAGFGSKKVEVKPLAEGQFEVKIPSTDPAKVQKAENNIDIIAPNLKTLGVTLTFVSSRTTDADTIVVYQAEHNAASIDMNKLIDAVVKRVNPGGQLEVAVRKVGGDQIEVAIPKVEASEIEQIKKKISTAGALEFRIVADKRLITLPEYKEAIDAALAAKDNPSNEVSNGQKVVATWVYLETKRPPESTWVTRDLKKRTQVLVLKDDYDVTGDLLDSAAWSFGEEGNEVDFTFKSEGARRFGELTGSNLADPLNNIPHELAIVLDGELRSAASIRSRITDRGRITGSFSREEVDLIVNVLNAGALPAALQKEPISEDSISAELGQDTIRNSFLSMFVATALVLVFMLFYYRFAGIVANLAVILNLVLVVALMIIFKAAFTLAGLAGLVLSVGMAVDSNVLIYERMREEKERGAALRMVIRNGFGRAMATIIDTHSTTIITGIILFAIGTEQLRGFAVTLVMGLVVNLFTAVFCARVMFDVFERRRWLKELKMLKLFGETNIDFVRIMKPAIIVSILISVAGLIAVWQRGRTILDVDFTGGSEVQVAFVPEKPLDVAEVRKALEQPSVVAKLPDPTVNAVTSSSVKENTQFVIRTSNDDISDVKKQLAGVFGDRLRHYQAASATDLKQIKAAPAKTTPEVKPGGGSASSTTGASGAGASSTTGTSEKTTPAATSTTGAEKNPKPPEEPTPKEPPTTPEPPPKTDPKTPPTDAKDAKDTNPQKKDDKDAAAPKTDDKGTPETTSKGALLNRPGRALLALASPSLFLADDPPADKNDPKAAATDKAGETPKADDKKSGDKTADDKKTEEKKAADADKSAPATTGTAAAATTGTGGSSTSTTAAAKSSTTDAATTTTNSRFPPPELPDSTSNFLNRNAAPAAADSFASGSEVTLTFPDKIAYESLRVLIDQVIAGKGIRYELSNPESTPGDNKAHGLWTLKLSVPPSDAKPILDSINAKLTATPVFLSASTIGSRVAGDMQVTAIKALVVSIIMIVLYIWIRFQNVIYGIGAVVALIHDVLVTVAGVALSYYVAGFLGFLLVDPFKISLNVVAALLTIVGYSISDTIVIFDRIREVRGKSPDLTEEMINKSVNQTLSRTVLTVFTVLLVTIILYIAGGQAIHAFAFTMLIGLISGTYSSVYIAAPFLLLLKLPSGQTGK